MKRFILLLPLFFMFIKNSFPQPKLIVGIVVDQMRYDYLYRFYDKYSDDGFKKLLNEGTSFENTHYNYVPTYTAPGHASIFTGTTPAYHGIIANTWWDKTSKKKVYCVSDTSVLSIGTTSDDGKKSPHRLLCTTIGDQLKLFYNQKSKVVGISLKDRAAILPAGHSADYAFWLDNVTGNFITSSFYTQNLPEWVKNFNDQKWADKYIAEKWELLHDKNSYTESIDDNNAYEGILAGETQPVFPHQYKESFKKYQYEVLKSSPYGNTLLKQMAIETITNLQLGNDNYTDFISISFSATDYIGHTYGPHSMEIEDTYLRLDKDIADLISFLDNKLGKDNYLLFLTADHAAVEVPTYLQSLKIPAGYFNADSLKEVVNSKIKEKYGIDNAVLSFYNQQVFLNSQSIENKQLNEEEISRMVVDIIQKHPAVYAAVEKEELLSMQNILPVIQYAQMGLHLKRSGDIIVMLLPSYVDFHKTGTTHGSPYAYDTHVPLLWYGYHVPKKKIYDKVFITDIAPSVCNWVHIQEPNCTIGKSLLPLFMK